MPESPQAAARCASGFLADRPGAALASAARIRLLVAIALALGLAACARSGGGSDGGSRSPGQTPCQAVADLEGALASGDPGQVWAAMSSESRQWVTRSFCAVYAGREHLPPEQLASVAARIGVGPETVRHMSFDTLCGALILSEARRRQVAIEGATCAEVSNTGSTAVVALASERVVLVAEDGAWRVDLRTTWRLHDDQKKQRAARRDAGPRAGPISQQR
jgi:hypothetical protein